MTGFIFVADDDCAYCMDCGERVPQGVIGGFRHTCKPLCGACHGTGRIAAKPGFTRWCPVCQGRGHVPDIADSGATRAVTMEVMPLSERDSKTFLDALANPPEPNDALLRAAREYADSGATRAVTMADKAGEG